MASISLSEQFADGLADVWSEKTRLQIRKTIQLIQTFPEIGSGSIPDSIRREYGPHVRKSVVAPFDIVYEYDEDTDTVNVLDLIHFRQAH